MKKLSELIPYFVGINDENDNLGIEPIDRLVGVGARLALKGASIVELGQVEIRPLAQKGGCATFVAKVQLWRRAKRSGAEWSSLPQKKVQCERDKKSFLCVYLN